MHLKNAFLKSFYLNFRRILLDLTDWLAGSGQCVDTVRTIEFCKPKQEKKPSGDKNVHRQ